VAGTLRLRQKLPLGVRDRPFNSRERLLDGRADATGMRVGVDAIVVSAARRAVIISATFIAHPAHKTGEIYDRMGPRIDLDQRHEGAAALTDDPARYMIAMSHVAFATGSNV
jgi:hypothetical protein